MATTSVCSVCEKGFEARFRYQMRETAGRFAYYCSHTCLQRGLETSEQHTCASCANTFSVEFPWQVVQAADATSYVCSQGCLATHKAVASAMPRHTARRIAVFNHKGGTGKTTTSINLAAGLAESGQRVLLVDADGQGNVGASLGIRGEHGLYHVLIHGMKLEEAAVPVRQNFDVLTSNETLAAAELELAKRPNRHRVMRERLSDRAHAYDVIVIDCAPALSLMNQNALVYSDSIIVPVSCDYLSLVGVKQVMRTIRNVRELLQHDVELLGVVPTFYDVRAKICRDAVEALTQHFGDRCLAPIRINTKLKEAPSVRQTIFEHAPESHGAEDYRALVRTIQARSAAATASPARDEMPQAYDVAVFSKPAAEVPVHVTASAGA